MSDLLAAAAAAMSMPEAMVQRSAAARAAETGASVDDILSEWAGGAPAPVAAKPAAEAPAPPVEAPATEAPAPAVLVEAPAASATVVVAPAEPYKPPILVGAKDNPAVIMLGAIGLFLVVLMVGLVGPSIPFEEPGVLTSEIAYSDAALEGQHLYESQGCAACHTQMVRPVTADVGLGGVTLNDSNQSIGVRRFGPDLSDVGSRHDAAGLQTIVSGRDGKHPPYRLADDDMAAVVAYLSESRTSG